jgi:predicted HicB family RNase H-like nuclease
MNNIETCREIGKTPEKPFSGKIILEIPPDVYLAVSAAASRQRKSIDAWITEACRKMAEQ